MRFASIPKAFLLALLSLWTTAAGAQTTDIEVLDIVVEGPASQPPTMGSQVRIEVLVRNNGPDTYDGVSKARPSANRFMGGRLGITVDIDEPSKPGLPRLTFASVSDSFAVIIPPGGTQWLDFGLTSFVPTSDGTHNTTATATPGAGNNDPNFSNNVQEDSFEVFVPGAVVPATLWWSSLALASLLMTTAWWARRRRMV